MSIKERVGKFVKILMTSLSPRLSQRIIYRVRFKRKINLKNPTTLSEKNIWLLINNYQNNALVKQCADKYGARLYLKEIGLESILVPIYGVYDNPSQINWDSLPNSFVIKITSGCGFNWIIEDKNKSDFNVIKKEIKKGLKKSKHYYLETAEMQYKGVKPKIIIEHFLKQKGSLLPTDYKIFCMNGNIVATEICLNRNTDGKGATFLFVDKEWHLLKYTKTSLDLDSNTKINKPTNIDFLYECAEKISAKFPFVRVDLYSVDDKCFFGEMTFTPSGIGNTTYNVVVPNTGGLTADYILGQSLKI